MLTVTFVCLLGPTTSAAQVEQLAEVAPKTTTLDTSATLIDEPAITAEDRDHWSFRPIKAMDLPLLEGKSRCDAINGIDNWIIHSLDQVGQSLAPPADKRTLIRRLTFSLTGLPPTQGEVAEFLADESEVAYENLVDRLLNSPEYGRHAAQWWLDLARFAETDGFEHDLVRPNAWRYRDWVIDALNQDVSFDRFVTAQLANDLADSDALPTMFCLAGPDMPDMNDQSLRRHRLLNEMTSTVGSVVLGVQVGCAECHDSKYDPISQGDYYRLRAVFESAVPNLKRDVAVEGLKQAGDSPAARIWQRGDLQRPGPVVLASMPRIADPAQRFQNVVSGETSKVELRLQFARALFDEDNPLVARVIVNRLWQFHFGRGLYDSPSDAGIVPAGPSHSELLDWLATELRSNQWSLKSLHRSIVMSATFRQSSHCNDTASSDPASSESWQKRIQQDPDNKLFSRFPRRRLTGEMIRDAMLCCADLVNHQADGPSVKPPLPDEMLATLLKGQWESSPDKADHHRRSIYVFARRNLRYPIFETFDRPDAGSSCPTRDRSTTALQSLQMINSQFSWDIAQRLASRIDQLIEQKPGQSNDEFRQAKIAALFEIALARKPSAAELQMCIEQLVSSEPSSRQSSEPGAISLSPAVCLAILNCTEFITLD